MSKIQLKAQTARLQSGTNMPEAADPSFNAEGFRTTRWTLIAEAGNPGDPLHDEALDSLLRLYRPALRSHLIHRRHMDEQRAEDLLQEFILRKILQYNLIQRADPNRGKFRTLLLTSLDNFMRSRARGDRADVELGDAIEPIDDRPAPHETYDVPWGRQVIHESLRRMETECVQSDRPDLWDIFESRILNPILQDTQPIGYDELVLRHQLQTPARAANMLVTAKRMFERNLRSVIGDYAPEDQIDAEISELREILSKVGT